MPGYVQITVTSDSSAINYTGDWAPWYLNDVGNIKTQGALSAGLSVSLSFRGTGIELWGYFDEYQAPTLLCNIDNARVPMQPRSGTVYDLGSTEWRAVYDSTLKRGNHTLTCEVSTPPFYLNYFVVHPNDPDPSLVGDLATSKETQNGTEATAGLESATKQLPVGAIVGGVIGGVVFVGVIVAAVLLFRGRKKNDDSRGGFASVRMYDDDGLQRHKKCKPSLRVFVDGLISRMRSTNKRKVTHHEDTLDSGPYMEVVTPLTRESVEKLPRSESRISQARTLSERLSTRMPSPPARWDLGSSAAMGEKAQSENMCSSPMQDTFAEPSTPRAFRSASASSSDSVDSTDSRRLRMKHLMLLEKGV